MTLAALLEELKEVDNYAYRRISMLVPCEGELEDVDNDQYDQDIVQGSIQRACERRKWGFIICNQVANVCTKTSTYASEIYDTPAEALLAVYITAVREEAKRYSNNMTLLGDIK